LAPVLSSAHVLSMCRNGRRSLKSEFGDDVHPTPTQDVQILGDRWERSSAVLVPSGWYVYLLFMGAASGQPTMHFGGFSRRPLMPSGRLAIAQVSS